MRCDATQRAGVSRDKPMTGGAVLMSRWSDVLVVGGGVIGGALAWSLAQRGLSVTVVEAGRLGRGASWAAAGVLTPDAGDDDPPSLGALAEASLALWPD